MHSPMKPLELKYSLPVAEASMIAMAAPELFIAADATVDAVMLEPVSDRRHHKSDDGTDSEKLDNRRQDTHKVKDDGGDDNAADDAPNAQRQNTGIAQRSVGLLGVLIHERTITPSGSILS